MIHKFDTYTKEEQKDLINFINRKTKLKNYLFLENDSEIINQLFEMKVKLTLIALDQYLEYHTKNENTKIVAMLLDFKNQNFSKKDFEELQERKELVEIGFELPTFVEFRKNWRFFKRNGEITITGYKGTSKEQIIPVSLSDGTTITCMQLKQESNYKVLEVLKIYAPIRQIKYLTFYNCENLKEILLPESLVKIDESVFDECSNLKEIEIPKNVEKLSDDLFSGCTSLKK